MRNSIEQLANAAAVLQAQAFLLQARDFYHAATTSDVYAAKPLLLYYSFLNLGKCFAVFKTNVPLVGRIVHGLSEYLPTTTGAIHGEVGIELVNHAASAFLRFADALGASLPAPAPPATTARIRSQDFLAQVLPGHRVYCRGEAIKERFVNLYSIDYKHDPATRQVWVRIRLFADDLSRLAYSRTLLASALGRGGNWRNVTCDETRLDRRLIEIEQDIPTTYQHRVLEQLNQLSEEIKPALWRVVSSYPPYRQYYVYFQSPTQIVLHQLLSVYITTFFFGSITRYKPESWSNILGSPIGPFVHEFFTDQPSQFLYLLASEFAKQEVAKPAIA